MPQKVPGGLLRKTYVTDLIWISCSWRLEPGKRLTDNEHHGQSKEKEIVRERECVCVCVCVRTCACALSSKRVHVGAGPSEILDFLSFLLIIESPPKSIDSQCVDFLSLLTSILRFFATRARFCKISSQKGQKIGWKLVSRLTVSISRDEIGLRAFCSKGYAQQRQNFPVLTQHGLKTLHLILVHVSLLWLPPNLRILLHQGKNVLYTKEKCLKTLPNWEKSHPKIQPNGPFP